VRYGSRARACPGDHIAPERLTKEAVRRGEVPTKVQEHLVGGKCLLSKEGHYESGLSVPQAAGGGPCTSMMNDGSDTLEEPLVRTVPDPINVFVFGTCQIRPSL
jgi:hypothetical protein